jgi:glycosyltransferase involved in cell wall biosynthesis
MKILFFSPYFYPYISGMTVYSKLVLTELNKKHEIEILSFKHDSTLPTEELVEKLKIFRMPFLFRLSKGFISPQSLLIFVNKIKNKDLLIINLPSVEGLFLLILAKLVGIKVLAIFHCKIDLGSNFFMRIFNLIINFLVRLQLALSTKIVAFSADYINNLNWSSKLKNKVVYIKPFVKKYKENSTTVKTLNKKKGNQYWIGFVGRIAREKGIDYLIQAIASLPNKEKYTVVFVGPKQDQVAGENKYYVSLVNKLKNSQINYLFLGLLSERDLFSFYKSIDLLVLPSINSTEAYGLVQLEAMSAGTPVIASDLPGIREPIQVTAMGLLVPAKNIHKLSRAIIEVIDGKSKNKYSKNKNKLESIFSKKDCVVKYEKIIKKII